MKNLTDTTLLTTIKNNVNFKIRQVSMLKSFKIYSQLDYLDDARIERNLRFMINDSTLNWRRWTCFGDSIK